MEIKKQEWESSYAHRDNFLFYPNEEVIRFVSKYIKKRIGIHEFEYIRDARNLKGLDLGCGIGRHVAFLEEMEIDAYGIDLSEVAVTTAIKWLTERKISDVGEKVKVGDVRKLPWENNSFDFVISHGVLDSMDFNIAIDAVKEVNRVLKKEGLLYCDLISGDDSAHYREFAGEEVVNTAHEKGTVQSYFNYGKILELSGNAHFDILECALIKRENVIGRGYISRYHVVLKKK